MKKLRYYIFLIFGTAGMSALFLLVFAYLFLSLGTFSLGLIAAPAALLGPAGVIHITTDLPPAALLSVSLGLLLLGFGMCLGALIVCPAALECFRRFRVRLGWKKRRCFDE